MSHDKFQEIIKRWPMMAYSMVRILSERLDATNEASFRDLSEKNRQLQKAYDELKAAQEQLIEKERLESELQVAAEIQLSILPDQLPSDERFDFGARIFPARHVGGDFYDVFANGTDQIGVVIGDVADKGIPSALFMRGLMRSSWRKRIPVCHPAQCWVWSIVISLTWKSQLNL